MTDKSIIIIGAGVAGLAAGCYGQMNGYRTQIFELHDLPGGLCTSWERKGYTFDGCIHYLFGSGAGQPFNRLWQELGVAFRPFHNHDQMLRVVGPDGRTLTAFADPDRLQAHMAELSPADEEEIASLAAGVRSFLDFDLSQMQETPRGLFSPLDWADFGRKMLPYALPMARWGLLTAREYAQRFQDPFLRRAIVPMFGWPDIPVAVGMFLLAYLANGNAGFPLGGSLALSRDIERRYLELGGEIHYKQQVQRILVEDDRAIGVRLYDDSLHFADYVVSAADGRGTIFDMLGGEYVDGEIKRLYGGDMPIHSQLQVSLGVDMDLSSEPYWSVYLLDQPLEIAGREHGELAVKQYAFDPSLAPPGKTPLLVAVDSDYGYWQRIYGRRLYDTEQLQVADIVVDWLEGVYPGIKGRIEVQDVATPLSYERYTGNWLGSTCGWLLTDKTMMMQVKGMDKTLPGLDGLYLAGHWVEPGGSVPAAAMSGRNAIQLICDADQQSFETALPVGACSLAGERIGATIGPMSARTVGVADD